MNDAIQYIAFLRGINVGGSSSVKMAALKGKFETLGFKNVQTLLTSGNVVFDSDLTDQAALSGKIEVALKKLFEIDTKVILRSIEDLKEIRASEPFKIIETTPSIRLYVTFFSDQTTPRSIVIPYTSAQNEFRILHTTSREVFSVLDLSKGKGTTEVMRFLEKEFGSNGTTRNWNTLLKILK